MNGSCSAGNFLGLGRTDRMTNLGPIVEPHYTLKEAVERFFPGGNITVRSLRTEIRKGRLHVAEVAAKFLVTEAAIAQMLESCQRCHAPEKLPDCTSSGGNRPGRTCGSSEMERLKSAQAAASMTIAELRKPSHATSPPNTNHPVRFHRQSSTSTKL